MAKTEGRWPVPDTIATRIRTETPAFEIAVGANSAIEFPDLTNASDEIRSRIVALAKAGLFYRSPGFPAVVTPADINQLLPEIALVHGYILKNSKWHKHTASAPHSNHLETFGKNYSANFLAENAFKAIPAAFCVLVAHMFQFPYAAFVTRQRAAFEHALENAINGRHMFQTGLAYLDRSRSAAPLLHVLPEAEYSTFADFEETRRGFEFHDLASEPVELRVDDPIFIGAHLFPDIRGTVDALAIGIDETNTAHLLTRPENVTGRLGYEKTVLIPRDIVGQHRLTSITLSATGQYTVILVISRLALEAFPAWRRVNGAASGTQDRHAASKLCVADFAWLRDLHLKEGPANVRFLARSVLVSSD